MAAPFVFVTTHTVNDGAAREVKELSARFAEQIETSANGLVAFHFYMNDEGTEVSNVQVHCDAASMDAYLPVAGELIAKALELTTTTRIDVFGTPGPMLQQVLQHNAELGASVNVKSEHLEGFMHAVAC
jgi:hypothetical protein